MIDMRQFLEVFIPLFVAIDAVGLIPIFIGLTGNMSLAQRRRVTFQAVGAATIIAFLFMFMGRATFGFIGIDAADFKVAGGIILMVLAVLDLLVVGKPTVHEQEIVGLVPLAMPLIAGPATLTTILILASRDGYPLTMLGLAVNFLVLLGLLLGSGWIARKVGTYVLSGFSKLVMVLLAAVAVNFIRTGIMEMIRDAGG
jgi:multiple antibiotic resistance protein